MKIRVDFSQADQIVMVGEVGTGKAVKKFTAKAKLVTTKRDAIEECYNKLMEKKGNYFANL